MLFEVLFLATLIIEHYPPMCSVKKLLCHHLSLLWCSSCGSQDENKRQRWCKTVCEQVKSTCVNGHLAACSWICSLVFIKAASFWVLKWKIGLHGRLFEGCPTFVPHVGLSIATWIKAHFKVTFKRLYKFFAASLLLHLFNVIINWDNGSGDKGVVMFPARLSLSFGCFWIKQCRWVNWQAAADNLANNTKLLNRASQSIFCLSLLVLFVQLQLATAQHQFSKWAEN